MNGTLESNGKTSSMRVGMFICIVTASYLAIAGLHLKIPMMEITMIVSPFLMAGIGGKVIQKNQEVE